MEQGDVLIGNDPAAEDDDVLCPAFTQQLDDPWKQRHVGTGEHGQPNAVDVLLRSSDAPRAQEFQARTTVSGPEAFRKYLADNDVVDREVEALFVELLDEASR